RDFHVTGVQTCALPIFVGRVDQIRHAVVLSGDGLAVGGSADLARADRERFAALASGLHSLAKGIGMHLEAGGVVQTMVELEGGRSEERRVGNERRSRGG